MSVKYLDNYLFGENENLHVAVSMAYLNGFCSHQCIWVSLLTGVELTMELKDLVY